jgi:hypothetical protein
MTLSVDKIFKETKYDRILFYLKERGVVDSDALKSFNFAELSFVPGVTEDLIDEAQSVFQNVSSGWPVAEVLPTIPVQSVSKTVIAKPDEPGETTELNCINKATDTVRDASVEQVFAGVPRSAPFVRYCLQNGKQLMSQLCDDDFDVARSLQGLGASSVNILHDTYLKFYAGEMQLETAESMPAVAADITVEQLFSNQPHGGLLIRHCHSIGIHTMADLSEFSFCAKDVNGIGIDSMEHLKSAYLEMLDKLNAEDAQDRVLPDIPDINRRLKLSYLVTAGLANSVVMRLSSCGYHIVNDLYAQHLSTHDYFVLQEIFSFLMLPITVHFENKLHSLKNVAMNSLLHKSQGETLQTIADKYDLTRERVRQIISKSCRTLLPYAEMVAQVAIYNQKAFESDEVQLLFENTDIATCCLFVLRESPQYCFLKFSDKFADTSCCPKDIEQKLHLFADEVIGDGLNFYDNLEHIEEELPKYNLEILDFEDIMNYLVQSRYRFYGDYAVKGKAPYAIICYDAISKYFLFDIKLDSDEANNDIAKLRRIIQKHYHGLKLPENNRALTAGITRHADLLILSGRGRYCPIEKVIYNTAILDDIYAFIHRSAQTSFYYNELFAQYQGRLLAETNITNANFLHGMLMYTYPDDFTYERDLLVKSGESRQDINERLCKLIISNGTAMTKNEIKKTIPGVSDFVIAFSAARMPRLIQWEYNSFNHMDNIHFTNEEIAIINKLVENGLLQHDGYMSESMLYNAVKIACPHFIEKNHICNSLNLFFVTAYLLKDTFRFRRPHILSVDFPTEDLSVANIARELLHCKDSLNYSEYAALANSVGWAGGTQYAVFAEIERDFVRIDEDNYVRRELFQINEGTLLSIVSCVESLVHESGYYAFSSIFSYEDFPVCGYEWNGFLLSSIIEECQTGFKIVSPQVRDRRYLRGVLLYADDPIDTFEELVLSLLKKDGIIELSDMDLYKYLKMHGLITKIMPQELYECEALPFKNDIFTVK